MLMSLLFAILTLSLQANQVATGLALTLFGVGLSAFAGRKFTGLPITGVPTLWHFDAVVYGSILLYVLVEVVLRKTRIGLQLRAVGESPRRLMRSGSVSC